MGSSKIRAQVSRNNEQQTNIASQHGLLDSAYRCVYMSQCIQSTLYLHANSNGEKIFDSFI